MIRTTMFAVAALFLAGQAQALSLTNRDATRQRVEVREGDEEHSRTVVIEPGQTLDYVCVADCSIMLADGHEMSFEGAEAVAIENGALVVAE